jgi:hypothetical protein
VTLPPDFEQLIGSDVEGAERARLQRVHALLVQAGPPEEISPSMGAGPTLAMTMNRRPARVRRRVLLLAAAVAIVAFAFLGGYIAGNTKSSTSGKVLQLTGTPAAPSAFASLQIEPKDAAGNWPMRLSVKGLPKLHGHWSYEVYLVRDGKPWGPCGSFQVATGQATVVQLNAPYRLQHGDSWVVLRDRPGLRKPVVVLKPV